MPPKAYTDALVYQYDSVTGRNEGCPDPYSQLTYQDDGNNEFDFEKGCENPITTKICLTRSATNLADSRAIQDIVVTAARGSPACPAGYRFATNLATVTPSGGNLNALCPDPGPTNIQIRLCVK